MMNIGTVVYVKKKEIKVYQDALFAIKRLELKGIMVKTKVTDGRKRKDIKVFGS